MGIEAGGNAEDMHQGSVVEKAVEVLPLADHRAEFNAASAAAANCATSAWAAAPAPRAGEIRNAIDQHSAGGVLHRPTLTGATYAALNFVHHQHDALRVTKRRLLHKDGRSDHLKPRDPAPHLFYSLELIPLSNLKIGIHHGCGKFAGTGFHCERASLPQPRQQQFTPMDHFLSGGNLIHLINVIWSFCRQLIEVCLAKTLSVREINSLHNPSIS
jgi:hypothetical protein